MSDEITLLRNDITELTKELHETNKLFVKVVSDNEHRDTRLNKHEESIKENHQEFLDFKEEFKPVLLRIKRDQDNKDGYYRQLGWIAIVVALILVTNSISSGLIKLPYQGETQVEQTKGNEDADS